MINVTIMSKKIIGCILLAALFCLLISTVSFAEDDPDQNQYAAVSKNCRLAVIKNKAGIYLQDETEAEILEKVGFGKKLVPQGRRGDWYQISYKEQTAYIRQEDVVCYNRKKKHIALTYDDGPRTVSTGKILDVLEKYNFRATFFVVGENVGKKTAKVLKREKALGCEIGNHSYSHPKYTGISDSSIRKQLSDTDSRVKKITGGKPSLGRAPYGAVSSRVLRVMKRPNIMWTVDTLDWKYRNKSRLVRVVKADAGDGKIVLMHDIHDSTAAAAEKICKNLKKAGYEAVTVTELAAIKGKSLKGKQSYNSFR
ncbi:MAG: polysaccharide deacetylase family protein [Eubacterium sp.]|nr:polysaccharide deacetylase family protein [Eubacterium sp.]